MAPQDMFRIAVCLFVFGGLNALKMQGLEPGHDSDDVQYTIGDQEYTVSNEDEKPEPFQQQVNLEEENEKPKPPQQQGNLEEDLAEPPKITRPETPDDHITYDEGTTRAATADDHVVYDMDSFPHPVDNSATAWLSSSDPANPGIVQKIGSVISSEDPQRPGAVQKIKKKIQEVQTSIAVADERRKEKDLMKELDPERGREHDPWAR